MEITLNGSVRKIPGQISALELLQSLDLTGKRLALEINREIVPRSTLGRHMINAGDTIEIVHAIGGG